MHVINVSAVFHLNGLKPIFWKKEVSFLALNSTKCTTNVLQSSTKTRIFCQLRDEREKCADQHKWESARGDEEYSSPFPNTDESSTKRSYQKTFVYNRRGPRVCDLSTFVYEKKIFLFLKIITYLTISLEIFIICVTPQCHVMQYAQFPQR